MVKRISRAALLALLPALACSPRAAAVKVLANAVSAGGVSGGTYAADDDPELVRDAVPFGLKSMEGLLDEDPKHLGLLRSLAAGFTEYGYAFVQQDADRAEWEDRNAQAKALRERARGLYLRARDYGLRGLDVAYPGLEPKLRAVRDLPAALAKVEKEHVSLLYWTAASWALAISTAKDRMDLVAELPAPEALMRRALALDEGFDEGAIHEFFISFDAARGDLKSAKAHFERAVALGKSKKLGTLVSYAEAVDVPAQDRAEFTRLLGEVVMADAEKDRSHRLANVLAQRRARLLLDHADDLFL